LTVADDCKIALITSNLVESLDEKTIEVDGQPRTTKCELQRLVFDPGDSDTYIELIGPIPEIIDDGNNEIHQVSLHFGAELHLNGISDDPAAGDAPIVARTLNIGAQMIKMIMTEPTIPLASTRGGHAILTRVEGLPQYRFDDNQKSPKFSVFIAIRVDAMMNVNDLWK